MQSIDSQSDSTLKMIAGNSDERLNLKNTAVAVCLKSCTLMKKRFQVKI